MRILWIIFVALAVSMTETGAQKAGTLAKYEDYRFNDDHTLYLDGVAQKTFVADTSESLGDRAEFSPTGRYVAFSFFSQTGVEGLFLYDIDRDRIGKYIGGDSQIARFEWFEYAGETFLIYSTDFASDEKPVLYVLDPATTRAIFTREGWVYGQQQAAVRGIAYYEFTTPDVPLRGNMISYDDFFTGMLKDMNDSPDGSGNSESFIFSPAAAKKMIERRSREVVELLTGSDFKRIATIVHPEAGVRISLDGHINEETDLLFSREQVRSAGGDKTKLLMGAADGTGDPIYGTLAQHFKYIGDLDYKNADAMSYNRVIGRGNTINNILEYFPQSIVVEYYWSGTEKYAGMDWRCVRFVFQSGPEGWCLVGIAEDFWTI